MTVDLAKPESEQTVYLTETLNYLNHFGKEIFAFLDDGSFPIDNYAERTIRKLTPQRNSKIINGCRDYVNLMPQNIGLSMANC